MKISGISREVEEDMNWDRATKTVKIKKYPEGLVVDKCCAPFIKKIDKLVDTMTTWSCCNHGQFLRDGVAVGGVEFISKLPLPELIRSLKPQGIENITEEKKYIANKEDKKEGYKGYVYEHICTCSKEDQENAQRHFKQIKTGKEE